MTFSAKRIDLTFQLGLGAFGESGTNTVKLTGLRVRCYIEKAGGASLGSAQLQIWGMSLSKMNQLSTLGVRATAVRRNSLVIEAGDEHGMASIFQGTIQDAWIDANAAPDVVFHVRSFVAKLESMKPVTPTSFAGVADVATIMSGLANEMGMSFENSGVTTQVVDPYLPGTAIEQVRRLAQMANISWVVDNRVLAIWPSGAARNGSIPVISPDTNMIGYPTFNPMGMIVVAEYTPSIGYGQLVEIKSEIPAACVRWKVITLTYELDSQISDGAWLMRLQILPPEYFAR